MIEAFHTISHFSFMLLESDLDKVQPVSRRDFASVGMQNCTDRGITDESDNDVECR